MAVWTYLCVELRNVLEDALKVVLVCRVDFEGLKAACPASMSQVHIHNGGWFQTGEEEEKEEEEEEEEEESE